MALGLLVHFNFGPGLVPEQSCALLVTYLLGFARLYLSPGTVRRAGIARALCPAPCAVLRLPNEEITEAHILTDPLVFDHSDYNVSSHNVSTAGATGDVQCSQVS